MHIDFKRRKTRKGQGLIPPNPTHWECEHNGLDLRDDLGIALNSPLDVGSAFSLLPHVTVTAHGAVPAAAVFVDHWRNSGKAALSGVSLPL